MCRRWPGNGDGSRTTELTSWSSSFLGEGHFEYDRYEFIERFDGAGERTCTTNRYCGGRTGGPAHSRRVAAQWLHWGIGLDRRRGSSSLRSSPTVETGLARGRHDTTLKPLEFFDDQKIELRRGTSAHSLDITNRIVTLGDGSSLPFDELVIATGLSPRRVPNLPDLQGVHVLRTLDESLALRTEINNATKALIVGAGFIGCEIAASAKLSGLDVVLIESQSAPLAAVLGDRVGNFVGRLHIDAGVALRTGVGLESLAGERRVTSALLTDGTRLEVDLVIVGIGSIPATGWLESSGVQLDNGIVCDEFGRTSADHVWAAGDVASWQLASGERKRHEHWSSAGDQARLLAGALCAQLARTSHHRSPTFGATNTTSRYKHSAKSPRPIPCM